LFRIERRKIVSQHDWFRNTSWDSEVESAFFKKLARARNKKQYLRIQASILATRDPNVALRLLDDYFAMGESFDAAQAYVDQATAYVSLNELQSAIVAFESALSRETENPTVKTQAGIELSLLIAKERITERYSQAITLLQENKHLLLFPLDRFRWNCALAFIRSEQGNRVEAREAALRALAAASETHSGFQYHSAVGLVAEIEQPIRERLSELAT
jgi:tetratricopeptide (TPR) repeat protein